MEPEDMRPDEKVSPKTIFATAVQIMARLRGPGGCPWDREQTFDTIRKYTLEETYEVFDASERRNWEDLKEELGDLFLQVLFYSQMASEAGYFDVADVVHGLNLKLVRRHPHVFGEEAAAEAGNAVQKLNTAGIDSAQVLRNWDEIKLAEKSGAKGTSESRLDDIPRTMPALLEATKLGSRAAKSGFDWPDVEGLFEKLDEEIAELREAILEEKNTDPPTGREAIESEVGDLLFTAVNLARRLKIDPEMALRGTNSKFRRRFRAMEAGAGEPLESLSMESLDDLWNRAKRAE
jgi:nucleoside triphosphate diphosphatase